MKVLIVNTRQEMSFRLARPDKTRALFATAGPTRLRYSAPPCADGRPDADSAGALKQTAQNVIGAATGAAPHSAMLQDLPTKMEQIPLSWNRSGPHPHPATAVS